MYQSDDINDMYLAVATATTAGLMHEVGDGVSQDFHLAKRFYDQAAETDAKAKLVRNVALIVLEVSRVLLYSVKFFV